jgi:hypothetical protein
MAIELVFERGPCHGLRASIEADDLPLRLHARRRAGNVEVAWPHERLSVTDVSDGSWAIYRTLLAFRKPGEPVECVLAEGAAGG